MFGFTVRPVQTLIAMLVEPTVHSFSALHGSTPALRAECSRTLLFAMRPRPSERACARPSRSRLGFKAEMVNSHALWVVPSLTEGQPQAMDICRASLVTYRTLTALNPDIGSDLASFGGCLRVLLGGSWQRSKAPRVGWTMVKPPRLTSTQKTKLLFGPWCTFACVKVRSLLNYLGP